MTRCRVRAALVMMASMLAITAPGAQQTQAAQSATEHVAAGDAEHASFNPAGALQHYEAALQLEPASVEALGKASRSAADAGEQAPKGARRTELYRKATAYARSAVEAGPENAEAHFHLARALGLTALSVGARERVRYATDIRAHALQALKLDPDHAGALHVMGVWHAEVMRLSGVQRFFAKNLLGGKVFSEASWKDAVAYMERAVAVDPGRLTHRLDLAKIYADVGEKAKAREQFELVLNGRQTDFNDPLYKREAAAALKSIK